MKNTFYFIDGLFIIILSILCLYLIYKINKQKTTSPASQKKETNLIEVNDPEIIT